MRVRNKKIKGSYKRTSSSAISTSILALSISGCGNSDQPILIDGGGTEGNLISGAGTLRGTNNHDIIQGSNTSDRFFGFSGNDIIFTGGGEDTVYGGLGDDEIELVDKDELIDGGLGDDTISIAGPLANYELFIDLDEGIIRMSNEIEQLISTLVSIENIVSTSSRDTQVNGSPTSNSISTGSGDDLIYSGDGNNFINTGAGDDQVTLNAGIHNIDLGSGDDIVNNVGFRSTILGNTGFDELHFNASDAIANLKVNLSTNTISDNQGNVTNLSNFEKIIVTGPNSVQFTGTSSNDFFVGDRGNDNFNGGGGSDQFFGGAGRDTFSITQNGTITIKDFETGDQGDTISYDDNKDPSPLATQLKFIDIKSGPQSRLTDSSDILIITSETGFESDTLLLLALNGLSGVTAHTQSALIDADMLSVWFNNNSNMCEVSIVSDTNRDNVLDTITSVAYLEDISVNDLASLSIENFQII